MVPPLDPLADMILALMTLKDGSLSQQCKLSVTRQVDSLGWAADCRCYSTSQEAGAEVEPCAFLIHAGAEQCVLEEVIGCELRSIHQDGPCDVWHDATEQARWAFGQCHSVDSVQGVLVVVALKRGAKVSKACNLATRKVSAHLFRRAVEIRGHPHEDDV